MATYPHNLIPVDGVFFAPFADDLRILASVSANFTDAYTDDEVFEESGLDLEEQVRSKSAEIPLCGYLNPGDGLFYQVKKDHYTDDPGPGDNLVTTTANYDAETQSCSYDQDPAEPDLEDMAYSHTTYETELTGATLAARASDAADADDWTAWGDGGVTAALSVDSNGDAYALKNESRYRLTTTSLANALYDQDATVRGSTVTEDEDGDVSDVSEFTLLVGINSGETEGDWSSSQAIGYPSLNEVKYISGHLLNATTAIHHGAWTGAADITQYGGHAAKIGALEFVTEAGEIPTVYQTITISGSKEACTISDPPVAAETYSGARQYSIDGESGFVSLVDTLSADVRETWEDNSDGNRVPPYIPSVVHGCLLRDADPPAAGLRTPGESTRETAYLYSVDIDEPAADFRAPVKMVADPPEATSERTATTRRKAQSYACGEDTKEQTFTVTLSNPITLEDLETLVDAWVDDLDTGSLLNLREITMDPATGNLVYAPVQDGISTAHRCWFTTSDQMVYLRQLLGVDTYNANGMAIMNRAHGYSIDRLVARTGGASWPAITGELNVSYTVVSLNLLTGAITATSGQATFDSVIDAAENTLVWIADLTITFDDDAVTGETARLNGPVAYALGYDVHGGNSTK